MSDLDTRIRHLVDAAALPVTLDEVQRVPVPTATRRPRTAALLATAAAVLVLVAASAAVVVVADGEVVVADGESDGDGVSQLGESQLSVVEPTVEVCALVGPTVEWQSCPADLAKASVYLKTPVPTPTAAAPRGWVERKSWLYELPVALNSPDPTVYDPARDGPIRDKTHLYELAGDPTNLSYDYLRWWAPDDPTLALDDVNPFLRVWQTAPVTRGLTSMGTQRGDKSYRITLDDGSPAAVYSTLDMPVRPADGQEVSIMWAAHGVENNIVARGLTEEEVIAFANSFSIDGGGP